MAEYLQQGNGAASSEASVQEGARAGAGAGAGAEAEAEAEAAVAAAVASGEDDASTFAPPLATSASGKGSGTFSGLASAVPMKLAFSNTTIVSKMSLHTAAPFFSQLRCRKCCFGYTTRPWNRTRPAPSGNVTVRWGCGVSMPSRLPTSPAPFKSMRPGIMMRYRPVFLPPFALRTMSKPSDASSAADGSSGGPAAEPTSGFDAIISGLASTAAHVKYRGADASGVL
mmetsp:Transcript_35319/g.94627  ORF Transcript_35319/g.94627 Transcript_35319/m.94627 type:complete len:227 (+) Transcript_35319:2948-3628(+)